MRTCTRRTSRRGVRATTDKNVPTRFFLSPFLTLSPFRSPPAPRSPPSAFILVLFGMDEARGTCEIAVGTSATVGTGRDETRRAERSHAVGTPVRLRRMIKRRGWDRDLMRRVDTVFLLSFGRQRHGLLEPRREQLFFRFIRLFDSIATWILITLFCKGV